MTDNLPEIGGLYRCHFQTGDEMIVKVNDVRFDDEKRIEFIKADVESSTTPAWRVGQLIVFDSYSDWNDFEPERVYNVAPEPKPEPAAWAAYHHDFSGMCIFETEIEALREAVKHGMAVKQVIYGKDIINDS